MSRSATVALTFIAVLLLVLVIDRWRQPEQLGAIHADLRELTETIRAQGDELRRLRSEAAARPTVPVPAAVPAAPTTSSAAPAAPIAAAPIPTGEPALDRDFLLPFDRSAIDPAHIGGTLRYFSSSPKGLNPLLENEQVSNDVHGLCNESLCERTPKNPERWSSLLAERVRISDDWKTYTITLRKGIRWQVPVQASKAEFAWLRTPHELTAEDVAFTVRLILDPKIDCEHIRGYYQDLDRCEVVDPYTLRLTWKKKVYTSLSATLDLAPTPRHIYGANRDGSAIPEEQIAVRFNKHWFDEERGVCGVGPFQLESFVPDKELRFRRNPGYWSTPDSHFEAIEMNLAVKQPEAQLVAFKNGQVHFNGLPPLKFRSEVLDRKEPRFAAADPANPKAGRSGELGWEQGKRMAFSYIGWNCRRPLFSDPRVRQAMSHLFPKERILREVFVGLGVPVLSDVHPDSASYNRDLKPYAFDPQRAKALLAEAGWTDSDGDGLLDHESAGTARSTFRFPIRYYANSPEWDNALAIYREELKKVGIEMEPKAAEWKELVRVYEDRDFDAVVGTWGMSFDLDFYQLWHSSQIDSQGGSNHCGFSDPQVDALAVALREEFDPAKRLDIIRHIQAIIHERQPYTFFMSPMSIFVWQNRAPPGDTARGRWLEGVTKGFDELHPLKNRSSLFWYFPKP